MKLPSLLALALGLVALPAAAQMAEPAPVAAAGAIAEPAPVAAMTAAPEIKAGETIWSADGRRIGLVDRQRGTTVAVVGKMKMIYIPIATLSANKRGLVSSLSHKEINRL